MSICFKDITKQKSFSFVDIFQQYHITLYEGCYFHLTDSVKVCIKWAPILGIRTKLGILREISYGTEEVFVAPNYDISGHLTNAISVLMYGFHSFRFITSLLLYGCNSITQALNYIINIMAVVRQATSGAKASSVMILPLSRRGISYLV